MRRAHRMAGPVRAGPGEARPRARDSRRPGRLRGDVAVTLGTMALRRPQETIKWLAEAPADRRTRAIELLREGFESLEEDFAEEQFFAAARATYWAAPEGSATRTLAASLIDR